jgi:hypothetical protein
VFQMSDLIHGEFHKHGLLYALHCKTINAQNEKKRSLELGQLTPAPVVRQVVPQPRQTPRLSLAQVKKAAAYPSAAAARSSLRRPSVTSAPEISQTTEDTSPTADVPPALIRQPEILPRV